MPQSAATSVAIILVDSLSARGYSFFTFCKVTLDLLSTRASTKENTEKHKNCYFCRKSVFCARKRSIVCRYIAKKCYYPAPTITHEKRCNLKVFANHYPSERHFWSRGCTPFSPHRDQLETRNFLPLSPSAFALAVRQKPSFSVPSRNGKQRTAAFHFTPSSLWWSMAFHLSATVLQSSTS